MENFNLQQTLDDRANAHEQTIASCQLEGIEIPKDAATRQWISGHINTDQYEKIIEFELSREIQKMQK